MSKLIGRKPVEVNISSPKQNHIPFYNETTRLWETRNINGFITGSNTFFGDQTITGSLFISGNNSSYSGAITVHKGVMNIQNSNALGTTDVATTVLNNAALQIQGGITVAESNLNITGTGVSNDGALRNISGNNIFSGTLNLTGNVGLVTKWQSASDALFTTPTDIANTTTTLTPTGVTTSTYYRAVVSSGGCTPANSSSVLITCFAI